MKRALFHYSILNVGGAERSTLKQVKLLLDHGWAVDVVLTNGGGALQGQIDSRAGILVLRRGMYGDAFKRARGVGKLYATPDLLRYLVHRAIGALQCTRLLARRYDVAVVGGTNLSPFLTVRVARANRRLHWIRSDLEHCDNDGRIARSIEKYNKNIDTYVCVSEGARRSLVRSFPSLEAKSCVIYNALNKAEMTKKGADINRPSWAEGDTPIILSVCRLVEASKGLLRMLSAHARILQEGTRIKWVIIGDGPDRDMLAAEVQNRRLTDSFILAGPTDNPLPYYRYADVVAVVSVHEGLSGVINEAKVMGRPVVATAVSGSNEQIQPGVNGILVENSEDAIVEGIRSIVQDGALREKITNDILPNAISDDSHKVVEFERLVFAR